MSGESNAIGKIKGSATKTSPSCHNIIKFCNNGVGGVDIIDSKTDA